MSESKIRYGDLSPGSMILGDKWTELVVDCDEFGFVRVQISSSYGDSYISREDPNVCPENVCIGILEIIVRSVDP